MSAEQVFLNSAQHDGALRNCLGLNFKKKKKKTSIKVEAEEKKQPKNTSPLNILRNQLNNFMQGLFSITEISDVADVTHVQQQCNTILIACLSLSPTSFWCTDSV